MQKAFLALAALMLAGCASVPSGKTDPRDPLERFNRSMFAFNDALDRSVARPVAQAYVKVTPRFVRTGVGNFFNNLDTLGTAVNDVLQGKMRQAGRDSARFLLNSTLGLGGLFDPATAAGLELNDEDFGQTLGKWGVDSGPYLVLPFLGPSTFRDTGGRLVDQFTYLPTYLEDDSTRYLIRGVGLLDMRAGLLDLDEQLNQSYDRYAFVRNAWLQRREFLVTDGEVAEDPSLELEEGLEEDPSSDDAAPDADPQDASPRTAPADPGTGGESGTSDAQGGGAADTPSAVLPPA